MVDSRDQVMIAFQQEWAWNMLGGGIFHPKAAHEFSKLASVGVAAPFIKTAAWAHRRALC